VVGKLTALPVLVNNRLNSTLLCGINGLHALKPTASTGTKATRRIHSLLQRLVFPSKYVIGVLAVASVVTVAEIEGVAAVRGPVSLVVELGRVPDNLEHELGNLDRVSRGAGGSGSEEVCGSGGRVSDVVLVVGAVEVDAVPASTGLLVIHIVREAMGSLRWEEDVGTDATGTCALGERLGV
jgi:hypothetical protein